MSKKFIEHCVEVVYLNFTQRCTPFVCLTCYREQNLLLEIANGRFDDIYVTYRSYRSRIARTFKEKLRDMFIVFANNNNENNGRK